jgi:hypothetical protein
MKRAIFLATVALLAMLVLAPMALAQGTTFIDYGSPGASLTPCATCPGAAAGGGGNSPIPSTGGSAILLPAAALLLGSGILTYAILRRR